MHPEQSSSDALVTEFRRFVQSAAGAPNVFEFLSCYPLASLDDCAAVLLEDLPRRLLDDPRFRIEHYLRELPPLGSDPDVVCMLVLGEATARRGRGESLDPREFQRRFPMLWKRIAALAAPGGPPGNETSSLLPGGFLGSIPRAADTMPPGPETINRSAGLFDDTLPAPPPARIPDPLGVLGELFHERYRITHYLGSGGMGFVYGGVDLRFDRGDGNSGLVAVKFMRPNATSQDGFRREAHLMRQFRHPNFVDVFDYGFTSSGLAFLVMEYLPGHSLEEILNRHKGPPPLDVTVKFVHEVCPALDIAHRRNLVHRDLKPANIMLAFEDRPHESCFKILDFGLSSRMDASDSLLNRTVSSAGTPRYMAPEQIQGSTLSPRTDLYSLGIILFQLLTGDLPFPSGNIEQATYHHVHTPPRSFRDVSPRLNIAAAVEAVVRQCLEKNPEHRPASAAEIEERLLAALQPRVLREPAKPARGDLTQTAERAATAGLHQPVTCSPAPAAERAASCHAPRPQTECQPACAVPPLNSCKPELLHAPFSAEEGHAAQAAWAAYLGQPAPVERNTLGMELVLIPPGRFKMGSPESDCQAADNEKPQAAVTLTQPVYVGKTEVTQEQWEALMGTRPWQGKANTQEGPDYPATHISADDADAFCRKLSQKEGAAYRLLTEAEWEYACRCGTLTRYHCGDSEASLGTYAWFGKNADDLGEKYAHAVGRTQANPFGLHDMHGNIREWCEDAYGRTVPGGEDPVVKGAGSQRVVRGGGWSSSPGTCRSGSRAGSSPDSRHDDLGFRVARLLSSRK